ncbi:MAG TPA: hypothetical protein PLL09_15890 [Flavobacterium sp.]|uniref:hypothetical protein n=1 Tax=unclassified Flavobacterium TaxID=196869 RepID=UPI000E8B008A|nr:MULTISPECIES: hypothetical protein [unclassified Flavobacterium]HBI00370.1 hypothetical protein [Flavobacterium sp.]HRE79298.1 hypothetical protein [Flavobacterium sp.]
MKTNLTFDLINGTFQPAEAKNVLFTLIKDKINFHELEMFSAYERYGIELPNSKKRVAELKNALSQIEETIIEFEKSNSNIQIKGKIEIIAVEKKEKHEVF